MNKRDRDTIAYAWSVLSKAERVMDHTTVEWAEVATAIHYIDHILQGRAADFAGAARVEHERFLSRDAADRMEGAIGGLDDSIDSDAVDTALAEAMRLATGDSRSSTHWIHLAPDVQANLVDLGYVISKRRIGE